MTGEWSHGDWIALAAVLTTLLIGLLGYLRKPSLVPVSHVNELRQRVAELEREKDECFKTIDRLEELNWQLERRMKFWQEQYEKLVQRKE